MMRGIGWDDHPEEYFEVLAKELKPRGVEFVVFGDELEFTNAVRDQGPWDFVVTDLVRDKGMAPGEGSVEHAISVASRLASTHPVYILTGKFDVLDAHTHGLPASVVFKSKSTYPTWMADDIVEDLKRRGIFVNRRKVFLIYGHDHTMPALSHDVTRWLKRRSVEVIQVRGPDLKDLILKGLLDKMQDCGAFVALCTPDDPIAVNFDPVNLADAKLFQRQPRQNVLLEIGMALGLSHGLQRLLIVQRVSDNPEEHAELPSDLDGVLTLQVRDEFTHYEQRFHQLLVNIGIKLDPPK